MMQCKKIIALLLSMVIVLSLSACGGGAESGDNGSSGNGGSSDNASSLDGSGADGVESVKVGALYSITGSGADNGNYCMQALNVAVDVINANGGIESLGGAPMEVVFADLMSDTNQCKTIAERILDQSDIVAATGAGGSTFSLAMLPAFEKAQVAFLTANVADGITDQGYEYVLQYSNIALYYGERFADFIIWLNEEKGIDATRVAILYENAEYPQSQAESTIASATAAGLEIVYSESYPTGMTDASALIANCINAGADVVYPISTAQDAKTILNTMYSMNYHPMVMAGGAGFLLPTIVNEMGDEIDGMISSAVINWDNKNIAENPELQQFIDAYFDLYGEFPVEQGVTAMNAIWLIKCALEESGSTDPVVVNETLHNLQVENMIPGGLSNFNQAGLNENATAVYIQWQMDDDGVYKPRSVWPEEFAVVEFQTAQ